MGPLQPLAWVYRWSEIRRKNAAEAGKICPEMCRDACEGEHLLVMYAHRRFFPPFFPPQETHNYRDFNLCVPVTTQSSPPKKGGKGGKEAICRTFSSTLRAARSRWTKDLEARYAMPLTIPMQ